MTTNPIIDPACFFGSALTNGDVKSILATIPQFILDNGVSCSNQETQDLNNELLPNYLTGPMALLFKAIGGLHENEEFAQCMWGNFYCNFVQDLLFFDSNISTTGTVSVTLPTRFAQYRYFNTITGINDDGTLTSGQNSRHYFFDTGSDDEIVNGNLTGVAAGGDSLSATQANFDSIMISVFAIGVC